MNPPLWWLCQRAPDGSLSLVGLFNKAFDPPCLFTTFATCPLPPTGNRLDVAVEAGEKMVRGYVPH